MASTTSLYFHEEIRMKKVLLTGMALAMLAVPAVASADVERYQTQTGSITVTLPQYNLVHSSPALP